MRQVVFNKILEDTARFAGLLLAPAEGFDLWSRAFFALWAKKYRIMLFWPILGHFWNPVVTSLFLRLHKGTIHEPNTSHAWTIHEFNLEQILVLRLPKSVWFGLVPL